MQSKFTHGIPFKFDLDYNFVLGVSLPPFLWSEREEQRPRERGCLDYSRAYHAVVLIIWLWELK